MTIYERILELCTKNATTKTAVENACGFSQNSINKWQASSPTVDKVIKVARLFHVSTDYLLCLTDTPTPLENHEVGEISDNTPAVFGEMSDLLNEQRFVDSAKMYRVLPNEYRQEVYAYIRGLIMGLGLPIQQILGRK